MKTDFSSPLDSEAVINGKYFKISEQSQAEFKISYAFEDPVVLSYLAESGVQISGIQSRPEELKKFLLESGIIKGWKNLKNSEDGTDILFSQETLKDFLKDCQSRYLLALLGFSLQDSSFLEDKKK